MEETLKKYFQGNMIAGAGEILNIEFLSEGKSSNHLNYKVVTSSGSYIARITRPGDLLNYSNLADEYTILKYVENFDVGPRAVWIDLEYFNSPILIEEYIDGTPFSQMQNAGEEVFKRSVDLLIKMSAIDIRQEKFPFKFAYTTYKTNFRSWNTRLEEIASSLGDDHFLVQGFKPVLKSAEDILAGKDSLLQNSPKEFIYNDVHPGNLFWLPKDRKAKFVDWQKVSIGDPAFMIALFARRFGHIWDEGGASFASRALKAYLEGKQVNHLGELFQARLLERAVSDMIWVAWSDIKNGRGISTSSVEENKFYVEAKALMSQI